TTWASPTRPRLRPQLLRLRLRTDLSWNRVARRKSDAHREHHRRGREHLPIRLASNHLREAFNMPRDDFSVVDTDTADSSRIEHRVDERIRVVVRLGQRLSSGASPELARLDSIEIDCRRDSFAKDRKQRRITRIGL